jgi:hypothetical protein
MDNFLNKIYLLINQHIAYVKRLIVACNNEQDFTHRTEHECEFGRLLYGEVMPQLAEMSEPVRQAVLEIERLHTDFHTRARNIVHPCENSDLKSLNTITDFMIIRLTRLEKNIKSEPQLPQPA